MNGDGGLVWDVVSREGEEQDIFFYICDGVCCIFKTGKKIINTGVFGLAYCWSKIDKGSVWLCVL